MAVAAAQDVFKGSMITIFKVLDDALITASDDAAKQAATDRAKKGIAIAQLTLGISMELANALPQK
jgi:hypothetical protein